MSSLDRCSRRYVARWAGGWPQSYLPWMKTSVRIAYSLRANTYTMWTLHRVFVLTVSVPTHEQPELVFGPYLIYVLLPRPLYWSTRGKLVSNIHTNKGQEVTSSRLSVLTCSLCSNSAPMSTISCNVLRMSSVKPLRASIASLRVGNGTVHHSQ